MQYSSNDLKEKLIKTIDKDYNVINSDELYKVITALETYPISRDDLEKTRMGKYVNEVRKKTKDKNLAKRIKNLVKCWQQLLPTFPTAVSNVTHPNSSQVNSANQLSSPKLAASASSPALSTLPNERKRKRLSEVSSQPSIKNNHCDNGQINNNEMHSLPHVNSAAMRKSVSNPKLSTSHLKTACNNLSKSCITNDNLAFNNIVPSPKSKKRKISDSPVNRHLLDEHKPCHSPNNGKKHSSSKSNSKHNSHNSPSEKNSKESLKKNREKSKLPKPSNDSYNENNVKTSTRKVEAEADLNYKNKNINNEKGVSDKLSSNNLVSSSKEKRNNIKSRSSPKEKSLSRSKDKEKLASPVVRKLINSPKTSLKYLPNDEPISTKKYIPASPKPSTSSPNLRRGYTSSPLMKSVNSPLTRVSSQIISPEISPRSKKKKVPTATLR